MLVAVAAVVGSEWTIGLLLKGVNSFLPLVKLFGVIGLDLFMHRSCMDCLWVILKDGLDFGKGRKLRWLG